MQDNYASPPSRKDWFESNYKRPVKGKDGEGCDLNPDACSKPSSGPTGGTSDASIMLAHAGVVAMAAALVL